VAAKIVFFIGYSSPEGCTTIQSSSGVAVSGYHR
jgi:hypothetical protein